MRKFSILEEEWPKIAITHFPKLMLKGRIKLMKNENLLGSRLDERHDHK